MLLKEEVNQMVSHFVIPSKIYFGGASPFAFAEQGVAMLSSILKSRKAILVNIAIMRAFVFLRQYAISHKDLSERLASLEAKYNKPFKDVYEALDYLITKDKQESKQKTAEESGSKNI